jgi:Xaa-Pro aminopeptidase
MPVEVSGESSQDKRQRVAAVLAANNADYLAVTLPDNIAWLLNVGQISQPVRYRSHLPWSRDGHVEWFVNETSSRPA